eukprot:TRINITY_DN891_c0_g1_i2.p1 TRINITY_DN891_c0_g1~~TRINITY_DN891_c0_g1_i2.p1  ORF type:complete len:127 (-),score=25.74 TRINITY_DN891_c0_g1_i2:75-455(-)
MKKSGNSSEESSEETFSSIVNKEFFRLKYAVAPPWWLEEFIVYCRDCNVNAQNIDTVSEYFRVNKVQLDEIYDSEKATRIIGDIVPNSLQQIRILNAIKKTVSKVLPMNTRYVALNKRRIIFTHEI